MCAYRIPGSTCAIRQGLPGITSERLCREIPVDGLVAFGTTLVGCVCRFRRRDDDRFARAPVFRRGDAVGVGRLQSLQQAYEFVDASPITHRIVDHRAKNAVRVDEERSTAW